MSNLPLLTSFEESDQLWRRQTATSRLQSENRAKKEKRRKGLGTLFVVSPFSPLTLNPIRVLHYCVSSSSQFLYVIIS